MTPTALLHIGRVTLSSLFVLGGVNKIVDPDPSLLQMVEVDFPRPELLLIAATLLELGGGLAVAAGRWLWNGRLIPAAALRLVLHIAAINVLLHPFWALDDAAATIELLLFFKNVAVAGGLLMVAALYCTRARP